MVKSVTTVNEIDPEKANAPHEFSFQDDMGNTYKAEKMPFTVSVEHVDSGDTVLVVKYKVLEELSRKEEEPEEEGAPW